MILYNSQRFFPEIISQKTTKINIDLNIKKNKNENEYLILMKN